MMASITVPHTAVAFNFRSAKIIIRFLPTNKRSYYQTPDDFGTIYYYNGKGAILTYDDYGYYYSYSSNAAAFLNQTGLQWPTQPFQNPGSPITTTITQPPAGVGRVSIIRHLLRYKTGSYLSQKEKYWLSHVIQPNQEITYTPSVTSDYLVFTSNIFPLSWTSEEQSV